MKLFLDTADVNFIRSTYSMINADGVIVDILDMDPFDLTAVPSSRPVMYALEVNQGEFEKRGIRPGNRVIFSEEIKEIQGNSLQ